MVLYLVLEVQSLVKPVRTISMDSTDGLSSYEVVGTETQFKCQLGCVYGRLFNVIGDAIDGLKLTKDWRKRNVNSPSSTKIRRFINFIRSFIYSIKVIDLIEPYSKSDLFGGAGVGKTVLIQELINILQITVDFQYSQE
jgi:F-type H+-transporting ATPase subunit beta